MANSAADKRSPQNERSGATRDVRERRKPSDAVQPLPKPVRRRSANEITAAIGLTPITGLSGPKIAY